MRESLRIDSPFMGGWDAEKGYSRDLRGARYPPSCGDRCVATRGSRAFRGQRGVGGKVAAALVSGEAPHPKPRGGSVSPLEEFAVEILDLIAQRPDLTLVETVAELRKRRIKTSRSSRSGVFLDRHSITLKKSAASSRTAASRCGASAPPQDTRARYA